MISFKSFVNAVHDAIMNASDSLMDKNEGLLDKYFEETETIIEGAGAKSNIRKRTLVPKTVTLDYPSLQPDGSVKTTHVQVPLITLVPISSSQIEKATLTADFEMEIIDNVLQLHFTNGSKSPNGNFFKRSKTNRGTLEIVLSPQQSTDGLKLVIEGYEAILKRQIS
ncbi:MAG: hypothetical protein JWO09_772 [Bacteroidetes bacterium]|nr:hypothetical protein [Bacteroidota bacterium]